MSIVPDDVTVTDWPYSVGLFLMALVALVSCSRESPDDPPSSLGKTKGSAHAVQAQVNRCAERIFFRLRMWGLGGSRPS